MAAILDPRFKLLWCRYAEEKEKVQAILLEEMRKLKPSEVTDHYSTGPQGSPPASEPPKKKRKNFMFMDDDRQKSSSSNTSNTDLKMELHKYLEEQCEDEKMCPLKYWQEHQSVFPSLAEIAKGVLGIPASLSAV